MDPKDVEVMWPGYDDGFDDSGYVTIGDFDPIPDIPEQSYGSFWYTSAVLLKSRRAAAKMIPSIVETLVGACDELSLLLRTLEITRTQNFISVKSVSTPSEAQEFIAASSTMRGCASVGKAYRAISKNADLNNM